MKRMWQPSLIDWLEQHAPPPAPPAPPAPSRLAGSVVKTRGTDPPPPPPVAKRAAS